MDANTDRFGERTSNDDSTESGRPKRSRTGAWIAGGLLLGILVGLLFGEYRGALQVVGTVHRWLPGT